MLHAGLLLHTCWIQRRSEASGPGLQLEEEARIRAGLGTWRGIQS